MILKDLIAVLDDDTLVNVFDDMGSHTDTVKVKEINVKQILGALERKIKRIYIDESDGALSIELDGYFAE
jgi:hypothetical protein